MNKMRVSAKAEDFVDGFDRLEVKLYCHTADMGGRVVMGKGVMVAILELLQLEAGPSGIKIIVDPNMQQGPSKGGCLAAAMIRNPKLGKCPICGKEDIHIVGLCVRMGIPSMMVSCSCGLSSKLFHSEKDILEWLNIKVPGKGTKKKKRT